MARRAHWQTIGVFVALAFMAAPFAIIGIARFELSQTKDVRWYWLGGLAASWALLNIGLYLLFVPRAPKALSQRLMAVMQVKDLKPLPSRNLIVAGLLCLSVSACMLVPTIAAAVKHADCLSTRCTDIFPLSELWSAP